VRPTEWRRTIQPLSRVLFSGMTAKPATVTRHTFGEHATRWNMAQPVIKLRQQAATDTDLADLSRNGQRFQAIERALSFPSLRL